MRRRAGRALVRCWTWGDGDARRGALPSLRIPRSRAGDAIQFDRTSSCERELTSLGVPRNAKAHARIATRI
eukprot:4018552-Prymnesium_polylepis.1